MQNQSIQSPSCNPNSNIIYTESHFSNQNVSKSTIRLVLPYIGYSGETADFLALIEKSNDSQREEAMRSLTAQSRRLVAQIDNLEKLSEGTCWQNMNCERFPKDVFDIIFCTQ